MQTHHPYTINTALKITQQLSAIQKNFEDSINRIENNCDKAIQELERCKGAAQ